MVHQQQLAQQTQGHGDMHDLTEALTGIVAQSGVTTGLVQLAVVGSTAAIGTIEFEPGLLEDLPRLLDQVAPPSAGQGHEQTWHDGNGHSHLQATLLGSSQSFPITRGRPVLGTWQQVVLIECDIIPRERTIVVTVVGE